MIKLKNTYLFFLTGLLVVSFFIGKSPIIKFVPIDNVFTNTSFTLFYFFSFLFIIFFFVHKQTLRMSKEMLLFPFVLILLVIELPLSLAKEEALLFYFAVLLLSIILILISSIKYDQYMIFVEYFIKFKFFLSLLIVTLALLKLSFLGIESFENNRLSIFGGPNIFIRFVFFLIIFSAVFIENRLLKLCVLFILAYVSFLSGSKAAFVVLAVYLLVQNFKNSIIVFSFIIILLQFINFNDLLELIDNKTILRALVVSDVENVSGSTTGRLDNFIYTWENFKNNPLFGIGLSSYPILNNNMQPHPHNIILELLNYGLFYMMIFIFSIFYMFYKSHIFTKNNNKYTEVMRQVTLYFIVFIMFSGDLFYSKDFYLSLFLYYILIEKGKKE